ncbi:MAG: hypothetical protein V1792_12440 [Pseudomonadota bacterium]
MLSGEGYSKELRGKRISVQKILVRILDDVKQPQSRFQVRAFLKPEGSIPYRDSVTRCWRTAAEAVCFDPRPTVRDLRHFRLTNAVRRRVYPHAADAIWGHGDKKKSLQSLYLTLSDEDLIKAIDMMKFDTGEAEIRVKK